MVQSATARLRKSPLFGHEKCADAWGVAGPGVSRGNMYEFIAAARTSHSASYGELAAGLLLAVGGSLLAFNVKGWAEIVSDFLGNRLFSAFYHNDLALRLPAGFFAVFGAILTSINLKILFFGF
ncbi:MULTISPECIES: hypothetical protein [Streptomyces]|uniref:hypothetical protein n=1 Tax=Streptomyces TaxID=1883 RepID=UPI001FB14C5A|nr:hypothetical protein [Streptomyces sp. M54]